MVCVQMSARVSLGKVRMSMSADNKSIKSKPICIYVYLYRVNPNEMNTCTERRAEEGER